LSIKCGHFRIVESCESCQKVQTQWYEKIKKRGFQDLESNGYIKGTFNTFNILQESGSLQSAWPETNFKKEEELLNHPDFIVICKSVFKHGNNRVNPKLMLNIWESHCEGLSTREIGLKFDLFHVTIFRAIRRLKELIKIMDLDQTKETVVIRLFDSVNDSPFLFATWRKSLWFMDHTEKDPIDPAFFKQKTNHIKNILAFSKVNIACLKSDPDHIVGFSVFCYKKIEFVYVKIKYRKQGVATLLTKGFVTIAKPFTKIAEAIAKEHNLIVEENREDGTNKRDEVSKEA